MKQADGGERGSGCYEDHAGAKTPATHSQRRIRRHLPEIGGEVWQRSWQWREAKSESERGRDGGKLVARRLEWGMRVGSAASNGVGYRQEVPANLHPLMLQHRDVATNATPGMAPGHWDVYAGADVDAEDHHHARSAAARSGGAARSADVGYEGLEWLFSCPSGNTCLHTW